MAAKKPAAAQPKTGKRSAVAGERWDAALVSSVINDVSVLDPGRFSTVKCAWEELNTKEILQQTSFFPRFSFPRPR